jgi:hypothetical protein
LLYSKHSVNIRTKTTFIYRHVATFSNSIHLN